MPFTIQGFIQLWAPDRQVSDPVRELFALIGRNLTELELDAAVTQSQNWLRPEDKERWDIPVDRPDDMARLISLLGLLGISEPVQPRMQVVDTAVVLGATSYSMEARLKALLSSNVDFLHLVMLGSQRPVTHEKEVQHLEQLGGSSADMNEGLAALRVLANADGLSKCGGFDLRVLLTPDREGKRATTDDTIQFLSLNSNMLRHLFVSHQPFGPRQALTVTRMADKLCLSWEIDFLFGPLSTRVDENPAMLIDTVGRTLWELKQLPHSYFE